MFLSHLISLSLSLWSTNALPDSNLVNTSEIVFSHESTGVFLGSPSLIRCPSSTILLASHDTFGDSIKADGTYIYQSIDNGLTWNYSGKTNGTYWATLFTRPNDTSVYILGTSINANTNSQAIISRSNDCGKTWNTSILTTWQHQISTGPTPVLFSKNRLWRAFERNDGSWASGYGSFVLSAAVDAFDLLDKDSWLFSSTLDFSSIANLVPSNWSSPLVQSNFGWLEGNAIENENSNDNGIMIMLRVNSLPIANKAALLKVQNETSIPIFIDFIEFPGGMTKFTIRRDPISQLYVSLVNPIVNQNISLPVVCGLIQEVQYLKTETVALPCCSMFQTLACSSTPPKCVWCHSNARNVLSLATSIDLKTWKLVGKPLMTDDSALPSWLSELLTGFQYVDWQFDGNDIIAAVRASYRGAQTYHNSNRILFQRLVNWRDYL
jgi:hypothetical protein